MFFWRLLLGSVLVFVQFISYGQQNPMPHGLSGGPYSFGYWDVDAVAGTYPNSMVFLQYNLNNDPKVDDEPVALWRCSYNQDSRSRFLGLNEDGIGMVNTSGTLDDPSRCNNGQFEGGRVGAVLLALDTRNVFDIRLDWKIRLMQQGGGSPLPREYRIMAEYRTDSTGPWKPFPISSGYTSKGKVSGQVNTYSIILPKECEDKEVVQIRWRYFQENGNDGGSRPMIALDDVRVLGADMNGNHPPAIIISRDRLPIIGCVAGRGDAHRFFELEAFNVKDTIKLVAPAGFYLSTSLTGERVDTIFMFPENGFIGQTRIYLFFECGEVRASSGRLRIESPEVGLIQIPVSGESYPVLYINEVMASNFNAYKDPVTKKFHDWIEIYNPNDFEVSLNFFHFSDNVGRLNKFQVPYRNLPNRIPPRSYKIYWASSDTTKRANHLNFSLSIHGETIYLVGRDGNTIIDSLKFDKQVSNHSYGRFPDGADDFMILEKITPAKTNNTANALKQRSEKPSFTINGGFFDAPVTLGINKPVQDAAIYYTLDGSDPDPANLNGKTYQYVNQYPYEIGSERGPFIDKGFNTFRYDGEILLEPGMRKPERITGINTQYTSSTAFLPIRHFNDAVVVKAISIEPGKLPSEVVVSSFFFDYSQYFKGKLPVISLVTQEDRLFDYYKGIYVAGTDFVEWRMRFDSAGVNGTKPANYNRDGRGAEIPMNIEVFQDGQKVYEQLLGARIHGNFSRANKSKSLKLYPRTYYGADYFRYPIFPELDYSEYKRLLLRNSGNDAIRNYFKDAFIQSLFDCLNVDNQSYFPYNIYINGEYWGLLNARERLDRYYLERKYGLDPDRIELIEKHRFAVNGSMTEYNAMMDFMRSNSLADDANYQVVARKVDVEDLQNHIISKVYSASFDWPGNNIKCWRYITEDIDNKSPYGMDGKWRWMYYDYDSGFEIARLNHNTMQWAIDENGNDRGEFTTLVNRSMMKNPGFRRQFVNRFCDQLNSIYRQDVVNKQIDWFFELLKDDISSHIDRWRDPATMNMWYRNVANLREFANKRPPVVRSHMRSLFGLSGDAIITLDVNDVNAGKIKINSILVDEQLPGVSSAIYPWSGIYFRNHDMLLVAVPQEGYKFSYWQTPDGNNTKDSLIVNLKANANYKAYFEVDTAYKYYPEPFKLTGCPYTFTEWSENELIGYMPKNMAFVNSRLPDAGPRGDLSSYLDSIRYDYNSRTRINGLGKSGISFVNSEETNRNYQPGRLAGAVVAVNTMDVEQVEVKWTGGTVRPGSKEYAIRLQYRIGESGAFKDVLDAEGKPVEYKRNEIAGHRQEIGPVFLPKDAVGHRCVQLLWRYHYTNNQNNPQSVSRDQLMIDDIVIGRKPIAGSASTGPYSLQLEGTTNAISYQWFKCENGIPIPIEGAQSQTLEIKKAGEYALAVEYDLCIDTSACEYFFVKEYRESPSSISFIVYPNPTESIFSIDFGGKVKSAFIYLIDVSGKVVKGLSFTNDSRQTIDIRSLPAGYYNIIVETDDGKRGYAPIVKI